MMILENCSKGAEMNTRYSKKTTENIVLRNNSLFTSVTRYVTNEMVETEGVER